MVRKYSTQKLYYDIFHSLFMDYHVFNFETYLEGLVFNDAKEEYKAPHSKDDLN